MLTMYRVGYRFSTRRIYSRFDTDTDSRRSRCHPGGVMMRTRPMLDAIPHGSQYRSFTVTMRTRLALDTNSCRSRYRSVIVIMRTHAAPDTDP